MSDLIPLFVAVPLGAGFLIPILGKANVKQWIMDIASLLVMGFLVVLSIVGLPHVFKTLTYWMGDWSPPSVWGIAVVYDGLSALILLIISAIGFIAILFSVSYMNHYTQKNKYYSLFMIMIAGMNGVVLSGDLFNIYVFLEVAAIASYALVAFGCESEELEASFKYLVIGTIASILILFGIGIIYNLTGGLNMAQVSQEIRRQGLGNNPALLLAGALFLMGFGMKAAMVPFHAWLPDAHPSAPAPISAMLSGVLIKAIGIYALCRIFFNVFGMTLAISTTLTALGLLSMIVGSFLMVGQTDFKRLLAYSSISHMGLVMLAISIGGRLIAVGGETKVIALIIFAGLFHLINHAVFKSLLFFCSGAMEYSTGTRNLKELGPLTKNMPVTRFACRIASLSISGIPPFNGFFSKLLIVIGLVMANYYWLAGIAVITSFVTLLAFIKVQRYALSGENEKSEEIHEVPIPMRTAMIILAVLCLLTGILVPIYGGHLLTPAKEVMVNGLKYARMVLH